VNEPHYTVHSNGYELSSLIAGKGVPLVFVHGTLGSCNDFERQIPVFSKSYRVVVYSRRYHPPNIVPLDAEEYPMDAHVEDLRSVIWAIGGSAHVVGSSYGGYVALLLALAEPSCFRTLILGEPPILPLLRRTREGTKLLESFVANTIEPARIAFAEGDIRTGVACFVDGVTGQKGVFEKLSPDVQDKLLAGGPSLQLEFLTELSRYMPDISPELLRGLHLPVLLLEGRLSPKFFHIITNELANTIPGVQRHVIPRTGHTMHSGNAQAYNQVVAAFLDARKRHSLRVFNTQA
jgi:pimeloyl-ACP methyl ester carboxylesterase